MNLEFVEEHKWTLVNLQYILQIEKCKICSKFTKIVFILDLLSKLNTKEGKVRRGRGLKHVLTESQNQSDVNHEKTAGENGVHLVTLGLHTQSRL